MKNNTIVLLTNHAQRTFKTYKCTVQYNSFISRLTIQEIL